MYTLSEVISKYKTVGHRNEFLFQWLYDVLYPKLCLSSVEPEYHANLRLTKAKSAVFITLIDDIADHANLRDRKLLDALITIPFSPEETNSNSRYFAVCQDLWRDISHTIREYPRYREFAYILNFDLKQVMLAEEQSWLMNSFPHMANELENDIYGHHGTLLMVNGLWDLMCSPDFDAAELGDLRECLYIAQKIARLCNMISTYHRELTEGDITSPIILRAIKEGRLNFPQMTINGSTESLQTLELQFREEVSSNVSQLHQWAKKISTVDVAHFADVMVDVFNDFDNRVAYWATDEE